MVEEIVVASEIHAQSAAIFREMSVLFKTHGMAPRVTEVPHEEFKCLTRSSEVIVRTGECTPYANVILKSGVIFDIWLPVLLLVRDSSSCELLFTSLGPSSCYFSSRSQAAAGPVASQREAAPCRDYFDAKQPLVRRAGRNG